MKKVQEKKDLSKINGEIVEELEQELFERKKLKTETEQLEKNK